MAAQKVNGSSERPRRRLIGSSSFVLPREKIVGGKSLKLEAINLQNQLKKKYIHIYISCRKSPRILSRATVLLVIVAHNVSSISFNDALKALTDRYNNADIERSAAHSRLA